MKTFRIAVLWAAVGSGLAVLLWSVLGGITWSVRYPGASLAETLRTIPFAILGSAYWALFIGAVAFPCYVVVFAAWVAIARRHPAFEATHRNRAFAACVLACPPVAMLTFGFASSNLGFRWSEAAVVFPLSALSCGLAIWLPRRFVPQLRESLASPAF
ncbi:MAG: hypothetical protein JWL61_4178 [Gemmatimonadetes bacterium]|nr:hypothetical protein [Gemmatimonadota bacterium]